MLRQRRRFGLAFMGLCLLSYGVNLFIFSMGSLFIGKEPIVKDVSHGWNVNIGYTAKGIAEITVLDAKAAGYWPLEDVQGL